MSLKVVEFTNKRFKVLEIVLLLFQNIKEPVKSVLSKCSARALRTKQTCILHCFDLLLFRLDLILYLYSFKVAPYCFLKSNIVDLG